MILVAIPLGGLLSSSVQSCGTNVRMRYLVFFSERKLIDTRMK